jgi:2'-5' RNA ligase
MNQTSSQRLFVAIAVPDAVKGELARVQRELREVLPPRSASWTRLDKLHLTLRFLGGVDAGRIPELERALRVAVTGFGELNLLCERLGCFPDLRFPRVTWAWVHDADEKLPALVQRVNEAAAPFAEKPAEAQFTGHITLTRPKQIQRPAVVQLGKFVEQAVTRRFGRWRADELQLIRSELHADGSNYTVLAKIPLVRKTKAQA